MAKPKRMHLYRHFNAQGVLLYVGISYHAAIRTMRHRESPWFDEVKRVDIEPYPTRNEAIAAERRAITEERPVHNIQWKPRRPRGVKLSPRPGRDPNSEHFGVLGVIDLLRAAVDAEGGVCAWSVKNGVPHPVTSDVLRGKKRKPPAQVLAALGLVETWEYVEIKGLSKR